MITQKFPITGIHCASCAAIITKHLTRMDGVNDVDVNIATEQAIFVFEENRVNPESMN